MIQHPGKAAFLISKPIQLMVALSIVQQNEWESKPVLMILNEFNGAREIAKRLSLNLVEIQTPIFFVSRKTGLEYIKKEKICQLFIDSDVGLRNFITLALLKTFNLNIKIHVFEEGEATYRVDLYKGIKKHLLRFFGIGTFFGGSRFVSTIYVHQPQEYAKIFNSCGFKVREISLSLSEFLLANYIALRALFGIGEIVPCCKKTLCCSIYLTEWKIDFEFISNFSKLGEDTFVKLHPHIRGGADFEGIKIIEGNVPAELVLIELMKNYQIVNVYDHSSSVRRYITASNVIFKEPLAYPG